MRASRTEGTVTLQKWVKKVDAQNNRTCREQTERAWAPTQRERHTLKPVCSAAGTGQADPSPARFPEGGAANTVQIR